MENSNKHLPISKTMKVVLIFGIVALVAIGAFVVNNLVAPKELQSALPICCIDPTTNERTCPCDIGGGIDPGDDVTPPVVTITSPANNSTSNGTDISVSATATDNVAVKSWDFLVDGTKVLSNTAPTPQTPLTTQWAVPTLSTGNHTLTVKAYDTSLNYGQASITVNVVSTYTLTTNVSPTGAGTITKDPNQNTYQSGTVVTLTASPASGYTFSNWSGDASGTSTTTTVTMNGNKTVTANFATIGTVATPTFTPPSGTYTSAQNVTISTATTGATIRYTTDGSTPSSTVGTVYTGPVAISTTTTLKAIAYKSGMNPSAVASANYTINIAPTTYTLTTNVSPTGAGTITKNPNQTSYQSGTSVSLTATPIPYNTTTASTWDPYIFNNWSGDITGTTSPTTITMDGNKTVTANFKPEMPHFITQPGTYPTETWVDVRLGAEGTIPTTGKISYTTNGSTPTCPGNYPYYTTIDVKQTTTIKAVGCIGTLTSDVLTGTFTITPPSTVATPTFTPPAGTYTSAQNVTISTATTGATIRYTTDGSTPSSTVGTVYTGPVAISTTTTLKAIAYKSGMNPSAVASANYTINIAPTCPHLIGDVNCTGTVDNGDLAKLANFINGDPSIPANDVGITQNGDINCTGTIDAADLAKLANAAYGIDPDGHNLPIPPNNPFVCEGNSNLNNNSSASLTLTIKPDKVYFFVPDIWKTFLTTYYDNNSSLCQILPDPTINPSLPLDPSVNLQDLSQHSDGNLLSGFVKQAEAALLCPLIRYIPYPYAQTVTFTVTGIPTSSSQNVPVTFTMTKESSPSGPVTLIYNNEPVTGTYSNGVLTFKKYFKAVYQTTTLDGNPYPLNTRYLTAKFCEVSSLRSTTCLKDLTSYFPNIITTTTSQFIGNTSVSVNNVSSDTKPLSFIKVTSYSLWPIRLQFSPSGDATTLDYYNQSYYGICDANESETVCASQYPANE